MPKYDSETSVGGLKWTLSRRASPTLKARFAFIFLSRSTTDETVSGAKAIPVGGDLITHRPEIGTQCTTAPASPIVEAVFDQAIEHAIFLDHDEVPCIGLELERPREPVRSDG